MRLFLAYLCAGALLTATAARAGTLAQFRTPLGDLEVELFDSSKPATVQNFIRYVQSGVYTNMFFHRWVPGFVIQGGGYYTTDRHTTNADFGLVPTFPAVTNEYSVGPAFSNAYGTIAMARVGGQTNSATSQWFFNLTNNAFLDDFEGGFTVFGKVVRGTNVLNRFNLTSAANGLYRVNAAGALNELPTLTSSPGFEDLIYVDITLLQVQVKPTPGGREIVWNSVSNKLNRVEYTTQLPPVWKELLSTNGTGQPIRVMDSLARNSERFYRIRVDY